jgi:hypothetical protein
VRFNDLTLVMAFAAGFFVWCGWRGFDVLGNNKRFGLSEVE